MAKMTGGEAAVPIKTPRLFREIQHFVNDQTIVVVDAGGSSYCLLPISS